MPETSAEGRAAGCAHHPERAPIGRCAACRRAVCHECHTRLDGVLHCRDCLGATAAELAGRRGRVLPRIATSLAALAVLVPALLAALAAMNLLGIAAGRVSRLGAVAFENADAPHRGDAAASEGD